MPESKDPNLTASLPERFDNYSDLVEGIVLRGMGAMCSILSMVSTASRAGMLGLLVRQLLMGSVLGHR
jgi:hypothetical protein